MEAGYSGTPLQKKLGMKPGHKVAYVKAPARFAEQFCDVRVLARLRYPPGERWWTTAACGWRGPSGRRAWPPTSTRTWSGLRFVYRLTARGTLRTG